MATATTRTLPTPPPPLSYQPASPSKKDSALKPNPHPYAIKTTSTGILTRSNSSGYNANATYHHYIPTSPSHNRIDSGKGHRSTKSLTAVPESPGREAPRPLPIPPELDHTRNRRDGSGGSGGYASADEVSKASRRPRRSETLPIIPLPSPALSAPPSVDDLPENPKLWTPSQLATYLTTALRMTSSGKAGEIEPIGLPALVAKDIATFVKSARIGGRTFLRLNEEDLEALGMNKKWRDALLVAARNLRQNVLKGRIWGADTSPTSSPSPSFAPSPFVASQPEASPSISPTRIQGQFYSNPAFNSSSSSVSSSASNSAGEENEATEGAALGRSKARRYKSGRVRGMIETFERSGSFSSDGGFEDEGAAPPSADRTSARKWIREQAQVQAQFTGQRVVESPSPSRRRPLPVPPSPSASHKLVDEEPTMEALLAELAKQPPVTGARAWEEVDLANGVTVKRVPEHETLIGHKTISGLGSGRSSGNSSNGKGGERRVVTAIFAPIASEHPAAEPLEPLDPTEGLTAFAANTSIPTPPPEEQSSPSKAHSRPLPPAPVPEEIIPESRELETRDEDAIRLERMLEEELLMTRALLDTFRARLEIVEQKVTDLEAREALRDTAGQAHAQTPELSAVQTLSESRVGEQAIAAQVVSVEIGVQSTGVVAVVEATVQSDGSDTNDTKHDNYLPPKPVGPSSRSVGKRVTRGDEVEKQEEQPPSYLADLPSYVFLVGLGVCAVVTQVVLRRVFGKGVWRP
ncbi:hypothetical protein BD310DRAFT_605150 [Dichomitus squalens]|uniref:SAM domain-containing protein n=1 Tax=Dichomitus squalens TaxID=114155 RepID=A0A4V2K7L5_9APHY|nr:hypothetical protein BD310DRAFT_605150 [Dichomitus squalens]